VGAGPGDPELLTVKAVRALHEADVVVYDRLVSDEVLSLVPPGAARVYAGKSSGCHAMAQGEINALLVRLAQGNRRVVRLKGGDPFIFGRGSEEAEHLARHGIDVEVVPGVTAASGCAAEFGIPLTHRGLAHGVQFVTGHWRENRQLALDWQRLADPETTLVVYMGLASLGVFCAQLIEAGLPPSTPAVAIASGTTKQRRLCRATLASLQQQVIAADLPSPVLFIIGRVAALARDVPDGTSDVDAGDDGIRNDQWEQVFA
jgi:uroporphyrin-III C-methyltransferase/precorrin-2 dehydrogenase/sirohydrochlorin ferrochelatase/uroporphyrin-III C-methyltransferase